MCSISVNKSDVTSVKQPKGRFFVLKKNHIYNKSGADSALLLAVYFVRCRHLQDLIRKEATLLQHQQTNNFSLLYKHRRHQEVPPLAASLEVSLDE